MPEPVCNSRKPNDVWRCTREPGHKGDHEVCVGEYPRDKEILAWPNTSDKPRASKRRSPVRQIGVVQQRRSDWLAAIKAERIWCMVESTGAAFCEVCGEGVESEEQLTGEELIALAWAELELHHTVKRSRAHGYRGRLDWGCDAPHLLKLVHRQCHRRIEGNEPRFGEETA